MNYHTPLFTIFTFIFLFWLKNFKKRESEPAYLENFRKLDEMKHKDYEYFEFSKEFNGDKTARKVQEARRKKIEHFCRNKQDDNQSLLSDPLRFKKYDGYICSPDPDNWLTQFSNLISKNLSRLELSFKQKTEVKRNEISSFILTEDPIRRFLKYFHFNARVQRYFLQFFSIQYLLEQCLQNS